MFAVIIWLHRQTIGSLNSTVVGGVTSTTLINRPPFTVHAAKMSRIVFRLHIAAHTESISARASPGDAVLTCDVRSQAAKFCTDEGQKRSLWGLN